MRLTATQKWPNPNSRGNNYKRLVRGAGCSHPLTPPLPPSLPPPQPIPDITKGLQVPVLPRQNVINVIIVPGRKYDEKGEHVEKRTHWSKSAIRKFQERAKCLSEQYSQYRVLDKFNVSSLQQLTSFLDSLSSLKGFIFLLIFSVLRFEATVYWLSLGLKTSFVVSPIEVLLKYGPYELSRVYQHHVSIDLKPRAPNMTI